MTAVGVSFDGTRLNDAEALGSVWTDTTNKAASLEPDLVWQNTYSVSEKVGTSELGVGYTNGTGVDMSSPDLVAMPKVTISNLGALNNEGSTGAIVMIGSGGYNNNYNQYYVAGKDSWEPVQRWLFPFIDPNVSAFIDSTTGTPNINSINWFAFKATFSGSSKAENLAMDAIDYCQSGKGLTLINGTSTDPPGTFQDFLDYDEGTQNNRYGVVFSLKGTIFCNLTLTIGTATATEFDSYDEAVNFTGGRLNTGAQGIAVDLQNASTVVGFTRNVLKSIGRDALKRFFDTDHQVDGTNEELDIIGHGFETGEAVLYSKGGGTEAIGLTDATQYWVEAVTVDSISLHTSRQNAMTAATPVNLTASTAGNGENHSLRRQPYNTAHFTQTGSSGTLVCTGVNFIRFGSLSFTSATTLTNCTFVEPYSFTASGVAVTGCRFEGAVSVEGEYLISDTVANVELYVDCTFVAGSNGGHAVRVTGTASTLDLDNVTWTGYGNDPGLGDGMAFHTISDVDATNDEIDYIGHGWTSGDPVYYSKYDPSDGSLGTDSLDASLADGALVYVRAVTADSVSLHWTRYAAENNLDKIPLATGSTGETHSLYSADAALVNNTGSAMQVNVTNGGNAPSVRNIGAAQTTVVVNPVTLTIAVIDSATSTAIQYVRVLVYADTGGNLPAEAAISSITRSGTTVTVTTSSAHNLTTGDKVLIEDTVPSGALNNEAEYTGVKTVTVTGASEFTFTVTGTPTTPATRSYEFWQVLIANDLTTAGGLATASRTLSADQPVKGVAFKGTAIPTYKAQPISGTMSSSSNTTITVPMQSDD